MGTISQASIQRYKQSHFFTRLMERHAINLSNEEYEQLILDIEDYNPKPMIIEDDGKSFHRVKIQDKEIIVLYDWEYRTILTCYHPSWLTLENGKWVHKKRYKSKHIRKHNKITNALKEGRF